MAIEQPAFRTLKEDGDFEIREYVSFCIAETTVTSSFKEAGNQAFWKLFHYIQGSNTAQTKIAMTAPVGMQTDEKGKKIAMTAPVSQDGSNSLYRVSFTLPSLYSAITAPKPRDESIVIRQIPARKVAVINYSGGWAESRYESKKSLLLEWVAAQSLKPQGEPILARYNSPYALWFLRHNEVQIVVE